MWFYVYETSRTGKFIKTESRLVVAKAWEWGWKWGVTFNGHGISPLGWGKCSKIDCGDGCTTLWIYKKNTELYTLKRYVLWYVQ